MNKVAFGRRFVERYLFIFYEKEKQMKKLIEEFKTFIKRGNVLDMAVGIIIGGAFTAIVNALSNGILKPLINWVISLVVGGNGSLENVYTFLKKTLGEDGTINLTNSIYIDWGAFVSAIINFLLIAIVVFFIVKTINKASENLNYNANMKKSCEAKYAKGEALNKVESNWVKRMKKHNPEFVPKTPEEKKAEEELAKEAAKPVPTETERLLNEILVELKNKETK